MTRQRFNKLATIYKLCAVLEVEPADVLSRITGICDKAPPDVVICRDEKLTDESEEELKEFIDDVKKGSRV